MAGLCWVHSLRPWLRHRHPSHVPGGEVVLRRHCLPARAGPQLLQRLWRRPHRHEHGIQLREGGPLHPRRLGGGEQRCGRRPRWLRPDKVCRFHLRRPDARLQNGAPYTHLPKVNAPQPGGRHRHRLRSRAADLLPLLQGL